MKLKRGDPVKRTFQLLAFVMGFILLVGVGTFGLSVLYPILTGPKTEMHQGVIEQRFTALRSGTTEYHFIVNETGSSQDVTTDAATWYTRQIGDKYAWETPRIPPSDVLLPYLLLSIFGFFSAYVWIAIALRKLWPMKPEAIE